MANFHLLFGLCVQIPESRGNVVAVQKKVGEEHSQHQWDQGNLEFAIGTSAYDDSATVGLDVVNLAVLGCKKGAVCFRRVGNI